MVQFQILSGKQAGATFVARRFPVRIGRSPAADVSLQDDGVWPEHLAVDIDPENGFRLSVQPDAVAAVNTVPTAGTQLRNGDFIALGSACLRFWLTPPVQSGLATREIITWAALAATTAGQLALIYWLSR